MALRCLGLALLGAAGACGQDPAGADISVPDTAPAAVSPATPAQRVASAAPANSGLAGNLAAMSVLEGAIQLARADHPQLDPAAIQDGIDALAQAYRAQVGADSTPGERAAAFARVLFTDAGFRSVDDLSSPEALHIDSVLARREGYCLSLSVVALAVAEAVGEPLYGVAMPNHFFVRWDDGNQRFNLELTRRGQVIPDAELGERMGAGMHADSLYLRNLQPAQVLGVLLHNRAFVALGAQHQARAEADLHAALELVPQLPEAHRTLGVLYGENKDYARAIPAFQRALTLYPDDVDALVNLGLCQHATGQLDEALRHLDLALLLDPGRKRAQQLARTWRAQRAANALPPGSRALDDPPAGLRPGLVGRYHRDTRLQRFVTERVDHGLDFDWQRGRPAPGVPSNGFSVRWEGWFKAPESALYTLFVVANDGVRIRFGQTLAVDHWRDAGYSSWTGTGDARLAAGWHPLQIDYYDKSDNARLVCIIGVEGREYPLDLQQHLFHERP